MSALSSLPTSPLTSIAEAGFFTEGSSALIDSTSSVLRLIPHRARSVVRYPSSVGGLAAVRAWWDLVPMSYEGSEVSELESQLRANARYAGINTLISWLGLAGSVVCIAMVG